MHGRLPWKQWLKSAIGWAFVLGLIERNQSKDVSALDHWARSIDEKPWRGPTPPAVFAAHFGPKLLRAICAFVLITLNGCTSGPEGNEKNEPINSLSQGAPAQLNPFRGMSPNEIRDYMVSFTKDLDASCSDCHDDDDMKVATKHREVTLSMIQLSRTFQTECKDCHTTLKDLTPLGKTSLAMKTNTSDKMDVPCAYCHSENTKFKLNKRGIRFKKRIAKDSGSKSQKESDRPSPSE